MSTARIFFECFHKECKEQRLHLLFISIAIPVVFAVLGVFFRWLSITNVTFVEKVTCSCLFAGLFAFGIDLLGGEWRRGRIGYLNRLPVGLWTVFWAKVASYITLAFLCFFSGLFLSVAIYLIYQWLAFGEDRGDLYAYGARWFREFIEGGRGPASLTITASFMLLALPCWMRKIGPAFILWILFILIINLAYNLLNIDGTWALIYLLATPLLALALACFSFMHRGVRTG